MQRRPGQYSDTLRVIGRLLDERGTFTVPTISLEGDLPAGVARREVEDVSIVEHEAFMSVHWTSAGSEQNQSFTDPLLAHVRDDSRRLRGQRLQVVPGERSDLLRTLGEELDSEGITLNGIFENGDMFVVSGTSNGRYVNKWYGKDELRALSEARRPRRTNAPAAIEDEVVEKKSHWWPFGR